MKLSKKQLQNIIQEEIQKVLEQKPNIDPKTNIPLEPEEPIPGEPGTKDWKADAEKKKSEIRNTIKKGTKEQRSNFSRAFSAIKNLLKIIPTWRFITLAWLLTKLFYRELTGMHPDANLRDILFEIDTYKIYFPKSGDKKIDEIKKKVTQIICRYAYSDEEKRTSKYCS